MRTDMAKVVPYIAVTSAEAELEDIVEPIETFDDEEFEQLEVCLFVVVFFLQILY